MKLKLLLLVLAVKIKLKIKGNFTVAQAIKMVVKLAFLRSGREKRYLKKWLKIYAIENKHLNLNESRVKKESHLMRNLSLMKTTNLVFNLNQKSNTRKGRLKC